VHGALPDELVKIKIIKVSKNYAVGKLLEILTPSKERCAPICQNKYCGGCSINFVNYDYQLKLKETVFRTAFRQNAKLFDLPLSSIITSQEIKHYRNKVIMPFYKNKDNKIDIGFYAKNSHRVVTADGCIIQARCFERILKQIKFWANANKISVYNELKHSGLLRNLMLRANKTETEILVCLIINGELNQLPPQIQKKLIESLQKDERFKTLAVCINKEKTNVLLNNKIKYIFGTEYIVTDFLDKKYALSVNTFFQVNYAIAELLYATIKNKIEQINIENRKIIFDVYAGAATIGIFVNNLAQYIYAIEENPAAQDLAKINFKLNNISNINFICEKAINGLRKLINEENIIPNIIILDPPRSGCLKEELLLFSNANIQYIFYVSCNPATLARDTKILIENDYKLIDLICFDMFPFTAHLEVLAIFEKKSKT